MKSPLFHIAIYILLLLSGFVSPCYGETVYDYSPITKQITKGCHTDYEKTKAIYLWLCNNISYDTSHIIYHADECYKARKGVCQAYCELFSSMAKSIDLRCEIIEGFVRDEDAKDGLSGHVWILAYTENNRSILLDPTWGSGSVGKDNVFKKSDNPLAWFDVNPEWMILSHYPQKAAYQLLDNLLTSEMFLGLPPAPDLAKNAGVDIHSIYIKSLNHTLSLPTFYSICPEYIEVIRVPETATLQIGKTYYFKIRLKKDVDFTLSNGSIYVDRGQWKDEGNSTFTLNYMPRDTGTVDISLLDKNDSLYTFFAYKIARPTIKDWKNVEEYYPLAIPEIQAVKNLDSEKWNACGIKDTELLRLIRQNQVKALPVIKNKEGQRLKIVSVPMTYNLKVGKSYTFSFYPKCGVSWAIINSDINGQKDIWFKDWNRNQGLYTMTIKPNQVGFLSIFVRLKADEKNYISVLEYEVNE